MLYTCVAGRFSRWHASWAQFSKPRKSKWRSCSQGIADCWAGSLRQNMNPPAFSIVSYNVFQQLSNITSYKVQSAMVRWFRQWVLAPQTSIW